MTQRILPTRFTDTRDSLADFGRELIVACPRCRGQARVEFEVSDGSVVQKRVCAHCGASEKKSINGLPPYQYAPDLHQRLDLWLQTPCCGRVLWALNEAHLRFLEQYVSADLRQRNPDVNYGWANQSLAGRLPRWITSQENRDEVERCLRRLRARLL